MNPEIGCRFLVAQQTAMRTAALGIWGSAENRYPENETGESSDSRQAEVERKESSGSSKSSRTRRHEPTESQGGGSGEGARQGAGSTRSHRSSPGRSNSSNSSNSRRQRAHERTGSAASNNTVRQAVTTAFRRATAQDSVESFVCETSRELEETPRVARQNGYRSHQQG